MQNIRDFHMKLIIIAVTIMFVFHWITCVMISVSIISSSLYFYSFPLQQLRYKFIIPIKQ